jgi:hypothetical protein
MYLNWGYAEDFSESPLFQARKSFTTANLCQKVDNSDQISSKSKLFKKAPTVDSKQARSKHEEKMKETEKRGRGKSKN